LSILARNYLFLDSELSAIHPEQDRNAGNNCTDISCMVSEITSAKVSCCQEQFWAYWSSDHHISLAMYSFLLVFYCDLRSRWNHWTVI